MKKKILFRLCILTIVSIISFNISSGANNTTTNAILNNPQALSTNVADPPSGAPGEAVWLNGICYCFCNRPLKGCVCVFKPL